MRAACAIALLVLSGAATGEEANARLKAPTDPKKTLWAYVPNELFFSTCQKVVNEVGGASGDADSNKGICIKYTGGYAKTVGDDGNAHCTEFGEQMAMATAKNGGAPLGPIDKGVSFCGHILEWSSFNRKTDMMTYFSAGEKKGFCTSSISEAMGGIAPGAPGGLEAVQKNLPFGCKKSLEGAFAKRGLQMLVPEKACKIFMPKANAAMQANELDVDELGAMFCNSQSIQGKVFANSAVSPAPLNFPLSPKDFSPTVTKDNLGKMVHGNFDSAEDAFDHYDTNDDEFIDRIEWGAMCDQLKIPGADCDALFKETDTDGDGKISREEWQNEVGVTLDGLRKMLLKKHKNANNGWKAGDKDGNGEMSMEEWIAHCAEVGVTEKNARKLFDEVDTDGSGTISEQEYKNVLGIDVEELKRRIRAKYGDTDKGFEAFDQDKNGCIDTEEWHSVIPLLDVPPERAEQLFKEIDTDGNGCISKEEWEKTMGATMEDMRKAIIESGESPEDIVAKMDKDGDGIIKEEEFKQALKEAGISDKDADDLWKDLDKDGDGGITKDDWDTATGVKEMEKDRFTTPEEAAKEKADNEAVVAGSGGLDDDGDGKITEAEFKKALEDSGIPPGDADKLWDQIDTDHDGMVTKEDILNAKKTPEMREALKKVKEKMDEQYQPIRDPCDAEKPMSMDDLRQKIRSVWKTTKEAWDGMGGKPLTLEDWKKVAANLGIPPCQAEKLFKQMDTNGDGLLTYEEFEEALGVTEDGFRKRALEKWGNADGVMKATDLNGDGKVDLEELIKAMEAVGISPANAQALAKEMMAKYDDDHDGFITGAKYREIMGATADEVKKRIAEQVGSADKFFDKCDTNHDGVVSEEEFVACTTKDLGITVEAAKKMFKKATEGGKPLSKEQFAKAFGVGKDEVLERMFRYEGNPQKCFEKYDRNQDHLLAPEEFEEMMRALKLNPDQIKRLKAEIDTNHGENTHMYVSKWELYKWLDYEEPGGVTWGDGFGDIDPFGKAHKKFNKLFHPTGEAIASPTSTGLDRFGHHDRHHPQDPEIQDEDWADERSFLAVRLHTRPTSRT